MLMTAVLFWGVTRRRVVIVYRRTFQTLRYRLSFLLGLLTREDGTDTFSRNVDKQLPHDAA
jgi:hypothetical protein